MDIELALPFISAELPGIGGQLRATTAHFVVEEIPLYEAQGTGQHLYVNLTKEGLTTREVQRQLAALFDLSNRSVGFAGMKDKHARTTQTFSLDVGHVDEGFVQDAPSRIEDQLPVTVNWAKLHRNKLKPGHLLGNHFTITVTELAVPAQEAWERAEAIAERMRAQGVPNYYGPQRLGTNGDNVRRGREIILGDRHNYDRWLRRLLISSYQSYLCNRYLAHRLESGHFDHLLLGDVAKKYDTGGLFEVEDVAAEQPRYERQDISFTAPVYGRKMWETSGPAAELEAQVLAAVDITMAQLAQAKVNGTRRLGRLLMSDLDVQLGQDGLVTKFSLPKGAFATTILREFMKVDYAALAHVPSVEDEN